MADRAPKLGLDARLEKERLEKYDVKLEQQARRWMSDVLGRPLDESASFHDLLKSGIILCEYVHCGPFLALGDLSPFLE